MLPKTNYQVIVATVRQHKRDVIFGFWVSFILHLPKILHDFDLAFDCYLQWIGFILGHNS
jgi:hypothetical protein